MSTQFATSKQDQNNTPRYFFSVFFCLFHDYAFLKGTLKLLALPFGLSTERSTALGDKPAAKAVHFTMISSLRNRFGEISEARRTAASGEQNFLEKVSTSTQNEMPTCSTALFEKRSYFKVFLSRWLNK